LRKKRVAAYHFQERTSPLNGGSKKTGISYPLNVRGGGPSVVELTQYCRRTVQGEILFERHPEGALIVPSRRTEGGQECSIALILLDLEGERKNVGIRRHSSRGIGARLLVLNAQSQERCPKRNRLQFFWHGGKGESHTPLHSECFR